MTPTAPYTGDPGAFESVVHDLVLEAGVRTLRLEPNLLAAQTPEGIVLVVRLGAEGSPEVAALVERLKPTRGAVVLAGWASRPGVARMMEAPWAEAGWIDLLHIADDGVVWPEAAPEGAAWTHHWLRRRRTAAPDWDRFWATVEHQQTTVRAQEDDFQRRLAANPPWATRLLVGAMVLIFGAELLVNAPTDPVAIVSMGALWGEGVREGQVWRMITGTLLHGNVPHVMMNLFVLWRVGNLLERILGTARFLVLYTVAALGGSCLSLLLGSGLSVGASGAIWGLMAAQFVLSLRAEGVLPEPLRVAMRSSSGQNLMLNLLVSFMPGVDWAAHAGGGLSGALAAFVLAASLTGAAPSSAAPVWIRVLATLGALLLLAGVGLTFLGAAAVFLAPQAS